MNGNRETFKTFAAEYSREKRTPNFSVETPSLPIDRTTVRPFEYERITLPKGVETRFELNAFSAIADVAEKLKSVDRVKYVVTGALWTAAALAAFALNSIVLVFDGGLLNVFFTTAGYLAYKQFKAALTGKPAVCLEFKCTNKVITSKLSEFFAYVKAVWKKLFSKTEDCLECVAFA